MSEKRIAKRLPAKLDLEVSNLFKQDNVKVIDINEPIEVFDVSKAGIGFISKSVLPVGYYFNAKLVLGEESKALNCVVKIIRSKENERGGYQYGCEIIGVADIMDYVFADYEKEIES